MLHRLTEETVSASSIWGWGLHHNWHVKYSSLDPREPLLSVHLCGQREVQVLHDMEYLMA